jgi:RHS repeat-associated protein
VISRRDFLPFGEEIQSGTGGRTTAQGYGGQDSIRQKFTGYERDNETDLDFAQARYYKSAHGRFNSPDDFLHDTKAVEPASWNLYVYVRNNPTNLIDPDGEKVYVGGLSQDEKDEVLKRMNYTYGCQNCVSVDADGYLQVDTSNLSKDIIKATQKLTDALNSTSWYAELQISNNDSKVAFGQGRPSKGAVPIGNGKKRNADLIVLDFGDDKWVTGDNQVKAAFLNTVLAHEILHFTVDPGKLTRDPLDDPSKTGKVVDAVNEILQARGLPLRERYGSFGQGGHWLSILHGIANVENGTIKRNSDGGIKVKANDTKKIITWLKKNVGGTGIN